MPLGDVAIGVSDRELGAGTDLDGDKGRNVGDGEVGTGEKRALPKPVVDAGQEPLKL